MAWDDLLLPASFRGIPFFVEGHEKNGGRNAVSHEPPAKDQTFAEDMGKKADGYRIRGHVLGDTYFFIRDALIQAMETKETGVLIHPYLGYIDVQPKGYTFSEETTEGRICRFELEFVEAGSPSSIGAFLDTVTKFISDALAAVAQIENAFAVAAVTSGLPGYAIESSVTLFGNFITTVENSLSKVATDINALPDLLHDMADLDLNKRSLLLNDKSQMATDTYNIIKQLKDVAIDQNEDTDTINTSSNKPAKLAIYDDILEITEPTVIEPPVIMTPVRLQEYENNQAINRMIRQFALIALSDASADVSYNSIEAGVNQRNFINDLIDEQMAVDGLDDNLFQALKDKKSSNVLLIPNPNSISGTTKEIEILASLPSLVIAYDFYGNVDNETDIIDRNDIANPAFINGIIEVVAGG